LVGCIFAIGVSTDVRNSITRWWAIRRAKKAGVSIPEEHVEKKKSALNIKRVIIIAVTWIGTLPLSGCLSAALVAIFRNTL
jgi:phosphate/sulfate permease